MFSFTAEYFKVMIICKNCRKLLISLKNSNLATKKEEEVGKEKKELRRVGNRQTSCMNDLEYWLPLKSSFFGWVKAVEMCEWICCYR